MKAKQTCLILIVTCHWSLVNLSFAQDICIDVIGSSGSFDSSSGGSIAWTMGEVLSETQTSAGNKLTQGFHQSNFCFKTGIVENGNNSFGNEISLFPNPFEENLTIDFSRSDSENFQIEVFDVQGKLLKSNSLVFSNGSGKRATLGMTGCSEGIYLLTISSKNKNETFKINKIN